MLHATGGGAAQQGARCMDCGVPFCHNGCPLDNLIPDWNDLVYRDRWQEAIEQLHPDEQLPRVHRPPLPGALRGGLRPRDPRGRGGDDQADRARDHQPRLGGGLGHAPAAPAARPAMRSPSSARARPGMAARAAAAPRGPRVTLFERDEAAGGLVRFGVPDFKIEKTIVERRVEQLRAEGVEFRCGVEVGRDVTARRAARALRRGGARDRLARAPRAAGPRARARRRALRDGVPLPAQPLGRARARAARREPPPAAGAG